MRFFDPKSRKGSGWPKFANFEEGVVLKIFEKKFPQNGGFERKMWIYLDL